ncbi:MAG: hypothetical protein RBR54_05860 [Sulfurimonas sp.]|jgi:hypothetical protein|nr:hypothetical protein [Sulfurimonas sp.]
MYKIISVFFLQHFILLSCIAAEPALGMLRAVQSNAFQKFSFSNTHFGCRAYGIVSLEELYHNTNTNDVCRSKIQRFYLKNPHSQYFSATLLDVKQLYHVEFRERRCIVYAQGQMTLSELLLQNGLALLKPEFQDKEFRYLYNRAQKNAKLNEKGIWADETLSECILFREEEE